jgi:hypothetical protein
MARRLALGISETSRVVRERQGERLLWRIVGQDKKVDRRRAGLLLNQVFWSTSWMLRIVYRPAQQILFRKLYLRVPQCFPDCVLINSSKERAKRNMLHDRILVG